MASKTTFKRFQCDPVFTPEGVPASALVQAFFETTVEVDGENFSKPWQTVSWDAVAAAGKTVTLGGKTYTYIEILAAVVAIAAQEKAATEES